MASKLRRIEVNGRKFGFKYGRTYLGVKEYRKNNDCFCGCKKKDHDAKNRTCKGKNCEPHEFQYLPQKFLSFAIQKPDVINYRTMRELIESRIGATNDERSSKSN